tara:strand:- start:178 stop:738 length:561 start_codon:yes stop_codon:yes gene_type:complete
MALTKLNFNGSGQGALTSALSSGTVIQTISSHKSDTFTMTGSTFTDIDGTDQNGSGSIFCCKITPTSTSNKILILAVISFGVQSFIGSSRLMRDSTALAIGDAASNRLRATQQTGGTGNTPDKYFSDSSPLHFLDSPNSTSEIVYKVQIQNYTSYSSHINRCHSDRDTATYEPRTTSHMTVQEIKI